MSVLRHKKTTGKVLVSVWALRQLEEAINRHTGGKTVPKWFNENADLLETDYDWIASVGAFLLDRP